MIDFTPFPKIARWSREVVITEKIDGTNASIYIPSVCDGSMETLVADLQIANPVHEAVAHLNGAPFLVSSRTRWITPDDDNYGFAKWCYANADALLRLGPGHHFGEWWGSGIQRRYGLVGNDKRFSLFNVGRWNQIQLDDLGIPCGVVPTLYQGLLTCDLVDTAISDLRQYGSFAAPGFMNPEGIIIYHTASRVMYKKTLVKDEKGKGE